MLEHLLLAGVVSALTTGSACTAGPDRVAEQARPAPPKGVAGVIVAAGDDRVDLRQKDGALVTVAMVPGWTLSYPADAGVDALRVGQFIGSANRPLGDGHGAANEVRVFEPGYLPEYGTHTLNAPGSAEGTMMTHGFVFGAEKSGGKLALQVFYPGGCRVIDVDEGMNVHVSVPLERSLARPGLAVSAVMRPGADGVMRAARLTVPARP
ncbi:hypothetical protein [Novosphingobium sediminicola]|uniref:Uncharacterized protein n=1 Tax=Novosphingobium sediminicola TaxID=563162 RepID=A0A7W6G7V2_9SPHN|nr:hypothetical protein [Novosphingobium sediminicola]MBB3956696.1 hypothetical protein [Novosphingobium sediminicola]